MKKPSERAAQHALVNILVFPGLGSLRAGRWWAGIGQIGLVLAGSGLLLFWLFRVLSEYYGQMFGDVQPQRSNGWIGVTGGVLFVISWGWAGVTSLSLFREAAKAPPAPPPVLRAQPSGPGEAIIQSALATLPQWRRNGRVIVRTFEFEDFVAAMKFVNAVAAAAELAQHHPDVDIRWNKVMLALSTHDAGGLTEKDFALARQCDALAAGTA